LLFSYVSVAGRLKDTIIRGGENLYPTEIEDFLLSHPGIAEAQVVGVPDERLGEELCVWIKVKDDWQNLTELEVREFCKGKLAHFKVPKYILFKQQFPLTMSGKIQKYKIKEMSIVELGLGMNKRSE
jgi:fatty-acyl-CoA synthase